MFVVAVTELASDLESEAYALAPLLGLSPYDVKTRLVGTLPRIVFQSHDRAEAVRALGVVRARGNGAVACDSAAVARKDDLVKVRRFVADEHALYANGRESPVLPWEDVAIVVIIAARTDITRIGVDRDLGSRLSSMSATSHEQEYTLHERVEDRSAFLFRRSHEDGTHAHPWLLHEREAQFLGLGAGMRATRHDNFDATLALVRDHAREAIFDDRFVRDPLATTDLATVNGPPTLSGSTAPRGIEVMANLLALALGRTRGGPYRR